MYGESSMRNGFGLRLLYKFLSIPYLHLRKNAVLQQLEQINTDTDICGAEITAYLVS